MEKRGCSVDFIFVSLQKLIHSSMSLFMFAFFLLNLTGFGDLKKLNL